MLTLPLSKTVDIYQCVTQAMPPSDFIAKMGCFTKKKNRPLMKTCPKIRYRQS